MGEVCVCVSGMCVSTRVYTCEYVSVHVHYGLGGSTVSEQSCWFTFYSSTPHFMLSMHSEEGIGRQRERRDGREKGKHGTGKAISHSTLTIHTWILHVLFC